MMTEAHSERPTLSRYEVLGRLASGGMGDVWLARASRPGGFAKVVALKTIRPGAASAADATEMFLREARVAAMLNHPNCVQVFDLGEEGGTYFIAMEYIDGFSLSRIARRVAKLGRSIPVAIVARTVMDAAAGLEYAHALRDPSGNPLGLVHRDVSLDNMLVTFSGQTKLVDFGIVKATSALTPETTASGQLKGKYAYMAPEYLRGHTIDGRADLFALGVVLYRALTNEKPFAGETESQIIAATLRGSPPPARSLRADIPELLDVVIMKALANEAGERFQTARAFRTALGEAVPDAADPDAVAAYLNALWPEDDPARQALRELAAGTARDSEPILTPVPGSLAAVQPRPATEAQTVVLHDKPGADTVVAHARGSISRSRSRIAIAAVVGCGVVAGGVLAVHQLRGRDDTAAPPAIATRPRPTSPPKPTSVLIADFENTTGDPVFDGTLEPSFAVALEGASFISAYNRGSAHKLAAKLKPGASVLDVSLARLVASREGIPAVLAGAIRQADGRYRVEVTLLDGMTGNEMFKGDMSGDKANVLAAVAGLAAKMRSALGDTTPESVQVAAAETFTTTSLEAAHEYALGQSLQQAGKWDDSVKRYLGALELDPQMGRAYAGIAVDFYNQGRLQETDKYFKLALSKIDRMSERERFRTRGTYYLSAGNLDKGIEELSALVTQYPADTAGNANLAAAYAWRREWPRCLELGDKAIALDPKSVIKRGNLAVWRLYSGDFDAAIVQAGDVLKDNPTYFQAHMCTALAKLWTRGAADAIAHWHHYQELGPDGASHAALGLADLALYEGRIDDAIQILDAGIESDTTAKDLDAAAIKLVTLAHAQVLAGHPVPARSAVEHALVASHEPTIQFWSARAYVELGDDKQAASLVEKLAAQVGSEPRADAELVAGEIELRHHRSQAALRHFEAARKVLDTWLGHVDLVRAYLDAGAFTEAESEAETCIKRRGEASSAFIDEQPTAYLFPPVHYYLGRALEGLNSPQAAESYKQFIEIKSHGSDPLLVDAKQRLAKGRR